MKITSVKEALWNSYKSMYEIDMAIFSQHKNIHPHQ